MSVVYGRIEGKHWLRPPQPRPETIGPGLVSQGGRSEQPRRPNIERTWLRTTARTTGGKVVIDP